MTTVRYFACGLLAALALALSGAGLGDPQSAHALDPACLPGDRCAAVHAAGGRFARALFRLQNAERRRHGLRPLPSSRKLTHAARRHARDMVRRHYFGHQSRGHDVVDRVAATGYAGGRFAAQENLYWWKPRPSPRRVLRAWMASSVHRANILNPAWSNFGLAVMMRSPFGRGGVTVVGVFGKH